MRAASVPLWELELLDAPTSSLLRSEILGLGGRGRPDGSRTAPASRFQASQMRFVSTLSVLGVSGLQAGCVEVVFRGKHTRMDIRFVHDMVSVSCSPFPTRISQDTLPHPTVDCQSGVIVSD